MLGLFQRVRRPKISFRHPEDFFFRRAHERFSVDRDFVILNGTQKLPIRDISVGGISVMLNPQVKIPSFTGVIRAEICFVDEEPLPADLKPVRVESSMAAFKFSDSISLETRMKLAELLEPLNVGHSLRLLSNDLRILMGNDDPQYVFRGLANVELSIWVPYDTVSQWRLFLGNQVIVWNQKEGLLSGVRKNDGSIEYSENLDVVLVRQSARIFSAMSADSGLPTILKRTLVRKV